MRHSSNKPMWIPSSLSSRVLVCNLSPNLNSSSNFPPQSTSLSNLQSKKCTIPIQSKLTPQCRHRSISRGSSLRPKQRYPLRSSVHHGSRSPTIKFRQQRSGDQCFLLSLRDTLVYRTSRFHRHSLHHFRSQRNRSRSTRI